MAQCRDTGYGCQHNGEHGPPGKAAGAAWGIVAEMRVLASEAVSDTRGRVVMLVALSFATFLTTGSGTAIAPFLLDMAQELGTDLAAVGNLVALMSISWGVTSIMAGAASDRVGRKPVLTFGLLVLIASLVGTAVSQTYFWVAAWRLFGGVGGGTFMGTVFATVSDRFPSTERGRALGWIVTGQSLSMVLGIPLVTFIGSFGGWRWAMMFQAVAAFAAAVAVWLVVPGVQRDGVEGRRPAESVTKALTPRVLALLGAGMMERVAYAAVAVFLATYLLTSYELSLQVLAVALALVAVGNLVGNFIGAYLTDRTSRRALLLAAALAATCLLALPRLR